jgi:hypothetical protein
VGPAFAELICRTSTGKPTSTADFLFNTEGFAMAQFDDRERGEEARYALSAETQFKIEARRNRLLGVWAAELMGITGDAARAYAADVVAADLSQAGDEDVFRKVVGDIKAKGLDVADVVVRQKMTQLIETARQQVTSEH